MFVDVESLKREWAIENLLFYRTVTHFRASFDLEDGAPEEEGAVTRREHEYMARAIFEEFIERGANSQVSNATRLRLNLLNEYPGACSRLV